MYLYYKVLPSSSGDPSMYSACLLREAELSQGIYPCRVPTFPMGPQGIVACCGNCRILYSLICHILHTVCILRHRRLGEIPLAHSALLYSQDLFAERQRQPTPVSGGHTEHGGAQTCSPKAYLQLNGLLKHRRRGSPAQCPSMYKPRLPSSQVSLGIAEGPEELALLSWSPLFCLGLRCHWGCSVLKTKALQKMGASGSPHYGYHGK